MSWYVAVTVAMIGNVAAFVYLGKNLGAENPFLRPLRLFFFLMSFAMIYGLNNFAMSAALMNGGGNEINAVRGVYGPITYILWFAALYLGLWGLLTVFKYFTGKKTKDEPDNA